MFAIYTDDAIFGVGRTVQETLDDARANGLGANTIVHHGDLTNPDAEIADFTNSARVAPDTEASLGSAKIRRCSAALAAAAIDPKISSYLFDVAPDGELVLDD